MCTNAHFCYHASMNKGARRSKKPAHAIVHVGSDETEYNGVRLLYIIGWIRKFFSFDPFFLLCDVCSYRRADVLRQPNKAGGATKGKKTLLCDPCNKSLPLDT